jgi:hypothetical protein
MRGRQLKQLWKRLPELRHMKQLKRDGLLMKLGAARQQWPTAWRLVAIRVPKKDEAINEQTFTWRLRKTKLRQVRTSRRTLSATHQPDRGGSSQALGILHATDAGGGGLQESQR